MSTLVLGSARNLHRTHTAGTSARQCLCRQPSIMEVGIKRKTYASDDQQWGLRVWHSGDPPTNLHGWQTFVEWRGDGWMYALRPPSSGLGRVQVEWRCADTKCGTVTDPLSKSSSSPTSDPHPSSVWWLSIRYDLWISAIWQAEARMARTPRELAQRLGQPWPPTASGPLALPTRIPRTCVADRA